MSLSHPSLSVVVVGDDAVAAGMLALDLVQGGVHAHAASDEFAVLDAIAAAREHGRLQQAAVVAAFDDIGRTTALWQRLVEARLTVRFVGAVRPRDRALAEHEAVRSGWLGVLERPLDAARLMTLLRAPPTAAMRRDDDEAKSGDLARNPLGELLDGLLLDASRGGATEAVLRLESEARRGEIAVVEGQLVHAVAEADQGRHALERMFCWRTGVWRLVYGRHVGARTLGGSWRGMLAAAHEYARRVEEARLSLPYADQVCQVRWERARPLPPVAEAMFQRVAAGMPLIEALDGEGDDELEAYAALLSRLGRGAVLPRDGVPGATPGTAHRGAATSAFNATSVAAARLGSLPVAGAHRQQSTAHSGWSQATPRSAGAGQLDYVEAPAIGAAPHRHLETYNYGDNTALAAGGRADPRATISGIGPGILPAVLPDPSPGEIDQPDDSPIQRQPGGTYRSTGWFGVNLRQDALDGQARLAVMGQSLVAGAADLADEGVEAQFEPDQRPTPAPTQRSTVPVSLTNWSDEFAAIEAQANEPSIYDLESKPIVSSGLLWILVAVLAASIALVLLAPGSSRSGIGQSTDDSPVMRTHRQAVAYVDQGRTGEATQMLRLIQGRPGVSPEAVLELAVLEIERGELEIGRRLLHQYSLDKGAMHAEAARRLYDHVFHSDLAPH